MGLDIRGGTPADLYITPQLSARGPRRQPDYLLEKKAIQELAGRMVHEPEQMLPRFVDLAMELTGGISAGLEPVGGISGTGGFPLALSAWRSGAVRKRHHAAQPQPLWHHARPERAGPVAASRTFL